MRIGVDVGGTKIDAVAFDGQAVAARVRIPSGFGNQAVVRAIVDAVGNLTAQLGNAAPRIDSIGVGIPGMVDPAAGRLQHAVNLGVDDLLLGPQLEGLLGTRVLVENDVNAASLGAYHLLGLTGSMAYLNLGTGLAAGVVVDGELWRGSRGAAGEIGHIPVDPDGVECACGQRGCLETIASGSAVARLWPVDHPVPGVHLFDAADAGDPRALEVKASLVAGVAAAIRLIVLAMDVDTVVVGGGLSNLGERLLGPVRGALAGFAAESSFIADLDLAARVRLAPSDQPVPAIGAALVAGRIPAVSLV